MFGNLLEVAQLGSGRARIRAQVVSRYQALNCCVHCFPEVMLTWASPWRALSRGSSDIGPEGACSDA